jgi:hypothetical protein
MSDCGLMKLAAKLDLSLYDSLSLSAAEESALLLELAAKAPGACSMAKDPGHPGKNWVSEEGGLPNYICQIARAIKRGGKSTSEAIAIAVGTVKKWAADPTKSASVRQRASDALGEWEKEKAGAAAHATVKAAAAKVA